MNYHRRLSHTIVQCSTKHSDSAGNVTSSLLNFQKHHLKKYQTKECELYFGSLEPMSEEEEKEEKEVEE